MHDKVRIEDWGLRILGVDIDETYGMQQLIIQEVNMRRVYWAELPDFIKSKLRDKSPYYYGLLLSSEEGIVV